MGKGNEDLKAKIAKIQQKGKASMPVPAPVQSPSTQEEPIAEEQSDEDMEALNAEFEARKKALMQKKTPQAQPVEKPEDGIEKALEEYADDAKFRVEVIFQFVQLNKSMKEIADALKSFANNGE